MGRPASPPLDQRVASGTGCINMGGVYNGRPYRSGGNEQSKKIPEMPPLSALREDMDPVEARRLQLWGQAIISDIIQWRHREKRRREGVRA